MNRVILGDNLEVLASIASESIDLIVTDPPFGTQKVQKRISIQTVRSESGNRVGFQGEKYRSELLSITEYNDIFQDYWSFMLPRIVEMRRVLKPSGSLYLHLDLNEVHYAKVALDHLFGRANFVNELIWAYDFGAKTNKKWPNKHNTILMYAKEETARYFDNTRVDREPYMSPGLVGPDKAERGKLPTSVMWMSIVGTNSKERQEGKYSTQKPVKLYKRFITASCPIGGIVLDPFGGGGTTGAAALELGCEFILVDSNSEAFEVMRRRFSDKDVRFETLEPISGEA